MGEPKEHGPGDDAVDDRVAIAVISGSYAQFKDELHHRLYIGTLQHHMSCYHYINSPDNYIGKYFDGIERWGQAWKSPMSNPRAMDELRMRLKP